MSKMLVVLRYKLQLLAVVMLFLSLQKLMSQCTVTPTVISSGSTTFCTGGSTTLSVSNIIGNAMNFDGVDDYASTLLSLNNSSAFTIEGWIKYNSISGRTGLFGQDNIIEVGFINSTTLECWTPNGGGIIWSFNNTTLPAGQWNHIAFVGNGTSVKLFVNGVVVSSTNATTANYGASSSTFYMGAGIFDPVGVNQYFNGSMDEVRVWTIARSDSQIQSSYNSLVSYNTPGLDAIYSFDEASGNANSPVVPSYIATLLNGASRMIPSTSPVGNKPYASFLWSTGETTPTINVTQQGNYSVTVNDYSACNGTSLPVSVTVNLNLTYYADTDNDGFGNPASSITACSPPVGYVLNNSDCNDAQTRYQDNDADGFGSAIKVACGGVLNSADCNDALTLYSDVDNDGFGSTTKVACNGVTNNTDCNNAVVFYQDLDADGFGSNVKVACGTVTNNTDCNDLQLQYRDNDGDGFGSTIKVACGVTNTADCNDNQFQYLDADGDGFGSNIKVACGVTNNTDCNDALLLYADTDGDGYGSLVKVPCGSITTNNDCDDTKTSIHPFATEIGYNQIDEDCDGQIDEGFPPKSTVITGVQCNSLLPAIDSFLYADVIPGAQGYQWKITTITGPNAGQVQTLNTALRVMKLTQLVTYAYQTTYKVEVAVYFAGFLQPYTDSNCTVTTPEAFTSLTNCDQNLVSTSNVIYANSVPYATGYKFKVTDPVTPSNTQEIIRSVREFRMNLVTAFAVQFGKTYNVEVSVKNINGIYMNYGDVCTVTTPAFPSTSILDEQCEDYEPLTMGTPIYAFSYPGVVAYGFNLSGNNFGANGVEVIRTTRTFKLSDFSGLIPGATYNLRVRLIFNANDPVGPYGKTCTVTVPGASRIAKLPFQAKAYPNPFADNFGINVSTSANENINIKMYDMTGRLLETHNVSVSEMESLKVGDRFPAGVYNVIVSQGEEVKTLRVVKR